MKSSTLICLFIFLAFSQLKAQIQKTIEGHSEVKALKVDVSNAKQVSNSGKKEGDNQGPMVLVDKPKDFEEFLMNSESNTKGLRPVMQVQITGSATDPSGVKVISVAGTPADLKARESRETPFSASISLAEGEHAVEIEAMDLLGNKSTTIRHIRIKRSQLVISPEWKKRNLYVLCIGVSRFANSGSNTFAPLQFADRDAQSIDSLFRAQDLLYNKVFTRVLTNEKADRKSIISSLTWLENSPARGDVAILFVSSHGFMENGKSYIMPYDGESDQLRATAIDFSDIDQTLVALGDPNQRNCRVLTLMDACHSGQFGIGAKGTKGASELDLKSALQVLGRDECGVMGLFSSESKEVSFERDSWKHGAFTLALLEALRKGKADVDKNWIVTLDELNLYVTQRVKELTQNKQHPVQSRQKATITEFPITVVK